MNDGRRSDLACGDLASSEGNSEDIISVGLGVNRFIFGFVVNNTSSEEFLVSVRILDDAHSSGGVDDVSVLGEDVLS